MSSSNNLANQKEFFWNGSICTRDDFLKLIAKWPEIIFLPGNASLEHVILAGFPRSGSTMIRNYIEKITHIFTGDDMCEEISPKAKEERKIWLSDNKKLFCNNHEDCLPNGIADYYDSVQINSTIKAVPIVDKIELEKKLEEENKVIYSCSQTNPLEKRRKHRFLLCKFLQEAGLRGSGLVGGDAFLTKTHYPLLPPFQVYSAHKCILLVRNPFDTFYSYFNLILTNSHTKSIDGESFEKRLPMWNEFIPIMTESYKDFYNFWKNSPIPTYIVRYEDLITNSFQELECLMKFLWETENLDSWDILPRLKNIAAIKDSMGANSKTNTQGIGFRKFFGMQKLGFHIDLF